MTPEEAFVYINRIKRVIYDLEMAWREGLDFYFNNDPEATDIGNYAELLLAHIQASRDERIIKECCMIQRAILYRYNTNKSNAALKCARCLKEIQDFALIELYGISQEEARQDVYYISTKDGELRKRAMDEPLVIISEGEQPEKTDTNTRTDSEQPASDGGNVGALDNTNNASAAPKTTKPEEFILPHKLDKPRAKAIIAKAIEQGYIIPHQDKLEWTKTQPMFAYFVELIFPRKSGVSRHITALEELFGVTQLSKYITANRGANQYWRPEIEELCKSPNS